MTSVPRFISILASLFTIVQAQAETWETLPLDSLEAFRPQAGNWRVVESVTMDPRINAHDPEDAARALSTSDGSGILLNQNDDKTKDHIVSRLEHGDIEISLEVMMPRGSNSGLYLQGRYELQLLDSWGVKNPSFADIGGIFRNWEEEPEKAFRGIAPRSNAAKAPGLWQTLHLLFRAPQFDSNGNKIANARFDFVDLNGIRIHQNIEVPRLTGGPISHDEVAKGPIMIQGDHGPVAFRNVRYRLLENLEYETSDFSSTHYEGAFNDIDHMLASNPTGKSSAALLDANVTGKRDEYGIHTKMTLTVPRADEYTFSVKQIGAMVLDVNGQRLIDQQNGTTYGDNRASISLNKGSHKVEIYHYKDIIWEDPRLLVQIEGSSTHPARLTSPDSFPERLDVIGPIYHEVGAEPRLQRGFFHALDKKVGHSIAVGDPSGTHYAFDLERAALLASWRGKFIDTTSMWYNRGDGTYSPRGAAQMYNPQSPFPITPPNESGKNGLTAKGYALSPETGLPTFRYQYQNVGYKIAIEPEMKGKQLSYTLSLSDEEQTISPFTVTIANAKNVEDVGSGLYALDDLSYYIQLSPEQEVEFVRTATGLELQLPFDGTPLSYSLIW
ncbi:family 16 glycoside hydrolase [Pelagicoccus mobilis]|uniref:DUF1080 domain-containing protein n=1 Tax=Pelagicoccus mobilis TaxID=415221 RepID=A0A934VQ74_9BACT|nr:family 16 glycoside hydrolase [Pelagicoccus mobilis]MBK1876278.1 DUF1080 domain-containing protein [Pelagicoccus mobilis]